MRPRKKRGKRAATARRNRNHVRMEAVIIITPKSPSERSARELHEHIREYHDEWPPGYDSGDLNDF